MEAGEKIMEDYAHIRKPDLGYRYEFGADELDAMGECLEAHGFSIIKQKTRVIGESTPWT